MMSRFIPRDKPKSWVIMLLSCLKGLLVAIPLIGTGYYMKEDLLLLAGVVIFAASWLVFAAMWVVYIMGQAKGRYYNLEDRDWCDQVW